MTTQEFSEVKEKLSSLSVEQMVDYINTDKDSAFNDIGNYPFSEVVALQKAWSQFQTHCKHEIVSRIKVMLDKFFDLGMGERLFLRFLPTLNVDFDDKASVKLFCKDYTKPYYNTWLNANYYILFHTLYVRMEDWVRGECIESEYAFPLRFLESDFDAATDDEIADFIEKVNINKSFASVIPENPSKEQKKAFIEYLDANPTVKSDIVKIFSKGA